MDQEQQHGEDRPSVGRRAVIKGAAVGAAAVWSTPIITSLATPAHAAGSVRDPGNPDPECAGNTCHTFVTGCSTDGTCFCGTTASGGGFCFRDGWCADFATCSDNLTCPDGFICVVDTCCGYPICMPIDNGCAPAENFGAFGAQSTPEMVPAPGTVSGVRLADGS